ncbi:hypothetical protein [Actinomadura miaoliensis]
MTRSSLQARHRYVRWPRNPGPRRTHGGQMHGDQPTITRPGPSG